MDVDPVVLCVVVFGWEVPILASLKIEHTPIVVWGCIVRRFFFFRGEGVGRASKFRNRLTMIDDFFFFFFW